MVRLITDCTLFYTKWSILDLGWQFLKFQEFSASFVLKFHSTKKWHKLILALLKVVSSVDTDFWKSLQINQQDNIEKTKRTLLIANKCIVLAGVFKHFSCWGWHCSLIWSKTGPRVFIKWSYKKYNRVSVQTIHSNCNSTDRVFFGSPTFVRSLFRRRKFCQCSVLCPFLVLWEFFCLYLLFSRSFLFDKSLISWPHHC